MFVGHGLLAFAFVAAIATRRDVPARQSLLLGAFAGVFATLPDVDMLYALTGLVGVSSPFSAVQSFWATGNVVHRAATHSLLIAGTAAVLVGVWRAGGGPERVVAIAGAAGVASVATAASGPLTGSVVAVFLASGFVVAVLAERTGLSPRATVAMALVGLVSHPFGDLLTGEPPELLFPLDVTVVASRVSLHSDPTLHLLGAFWIELATVWLALAVLVDILGEDLLSKFSWRATLGASFAVVGVFLPAPTLEMSYQFVVGVLGVGVLTAAPLPRRWRATDPISDVTTGLAAVTIASVAYAVTYLVV